MTAFRYHRLFVEATNGSGIVGLTEIELRTVVGGPDLTGPGLGTAISSGVFSGAFAAANAFDNTDAEYASSGMQAWVGWDAGLGNSYEFRQMTLRSRATDAVNSPLQAPKDFRIDGSYDAVTWLPLARITNQTAWALGETRAYEWEPFIDGLHTAKANLYSVEGGLPSKLAATKLVSYLAEGMGIGLGSAKLVLYGVLAQQGALRMSKGVLYVVTRTGPPPGEYPGEIVPCSQTDRPQNGFVLCATRPDTVMGPCASRAEGTTFYPDQPYTREQ